MGFSQTKQILETKCENTKTIYITQCIKSGALIHYNIASMIFAVLEVLLKSFYKSMLLWGGDIML